MNAAGRALVVLPVLAALAWMGAFALQMGVAGSVMFTTTQALEKGLEPARKEPLITWEAAHAEVGDAAARVPFDPALHELLGVIDLRRSPSQEYLAEAGVHLARALELRPSSPYTWSNLAAVKYRLGDTGAAFEKALVRAAALGPYEPEVQRNVSHLGLAVWNEVAPETRAAIEAMVASGMRRNPAEMLQIAHRRGRLPIACHHLAGTPRPTESKWSQLCQSTEATS